MKTIKMLCLFSMATILTVSICSCSNEINSTTQELTSKELQAFKDLKLQLQQENRAYYAQNGTRKMLKWLRKFVIFIADATSFLEHRDLSASAATSEQVKKALDPDSKASNSPATIIANSDARVYLIKEKVDELDTVEIANDPGYIHNKIIINAYKNNQDSLNLLTPDEFVNKVLAEGEKETNIKLTEEQKKQIKDYSSQLVQFAKKSKSSDDFIINIQKITKNPITREELSIMGEFVPNGYIVDSQTGKEMQTLKLIKDSNIPQKSKEQLINSYSILKASSALWFENEKVILPTNP